MTRACAICCVSGSRSRLGSGTMRSLSPFASRIARKPCPNSTSLTRRRSASDRRNPPPYMRHAISHFCVWPARALSTRSTSSLVMTSGTRRLRRAHVIFLNVPRSCPKTFRKRNTRALSAWFWVPGEQFLPMAKCERNRSISSSPISLGCCLP